LHTYINKHPVIAILRGISPESVIEVAQCLYQQGLRVIEVPLNSSNAIESIEKLVKHLPKDCLIGAGTVTNIEQIKQVANVGGKLIISPHCDVKLIELCHLLNLHVVTGVATPTEAFTAYQAGAKWLKLFPASTYGINHMKALKSVLPKDVEIIAVGGISEENSQQWLTSGASALGIGNSLYKKGDSLAIINKKMTLLNKMLKHTLI
jgi:2-dehydro-3-deoxyphosphogalactonate aldolase